MTDAKCGKPVENLLRRIANAFPAAQIIVVIRRNIFLEQARIEEAVLEIAFFISS